MHGRSRPIRSVGGFNFWVVSAAGHSAGAGQWKPPFLNSPLGDERSQAVERVYDGAMRMITLVSSRLAAPHVAAREANVTWTNAAPAPSSERFDGHAKAQGGSFRR
jgi:hypothetical protein